MSRLLLSTFLMYVLGMNYVFADIQFFFGDDGGGAVTCGVGNDKVTALKSPFSCDFIADSNEIVISRENWSTDESATLKKDNDTITIVGKCVQSITVDQNIPEGKAFQVSQSCENGGVKINFTEEDFLANPVLCSDPDPVITKSYIQCQYDESGKLLLSRNSWNNRNALLIKGKTITGQCAGSFLPSTHTPPEYNIVYNCKSLYSKPIAATGDKLVTEWYADLPWHQKLSTKDSNLIDTPFVLPYAALLPDLCKIKINNEIDEPRCMLRYGVLNIMAMQRTDTLYNKGEAPTDENCTDCVEVKIRIQRVNTLVDNVQGYQADTVRNNAYTIENYPDNDNNFLIPSLSFALTEATIFAPWRPWYTGHYCARDADNLADSVCYEDYFTTQLIATSSLAWLWDAPALFEPKNEKPEPTFEKFCASGINYCDMYLGKVDWLANATEPVVTECGDPEQPLVQPKDPEVCRKEIMAKTRLLDRQFNESIKSYMDDDRYPWPVVKSEIDLSKDIDTNPYIGFYELERFKTPSFEVDKVTGNTIYFDSLFRSPRYVLPKKCTKQNYLGARQNNQSDIEQLENCVLNFEIHTNGYYRQWRYLYGEQSADGEAYTLSNDEIKAAIKDISNALPGINANQYGRTMFLYAGVPEQHIPVTFKLLDDGISLYDKVYNASIYTQYLPMVNPADQTLKTKSYTDDFWHSFFMSNHMNQAPDHFIRGIRGRTLWHNEYRSNIMYNSAEKVLLNGEHAVDGTAFEGVLEPIDFPAGFQTTKATTPFHGNTCDACHIRNGSGIPLMPNGKLAQIHVAQGMQDKAYQINHDYTYSNKELPSMKMVLFDLGEPRSDGLYSNKIMNFYGDSFHVNQQDRLPTYTMKYVTIKIKGDYEIVDKTPRHKNHRINDFYEPQRIAINNIKTGTNIVCKNIDGIVAKPVDIPDTIWPDSCADVSGAAIAEAINESDAKVGFMHLLGRRLGNTPMIEMIPDQLIRKTQFDQQVLTGFPGNYPLVAGTRGGGKSYYRNCYSSNNPENCYISRWGWVGDRASLEDQIANAANVEMNMTSTESYTMLYGRNPPDNSAQLLRYNKPACGPADLFCQNQAANSDIKEQEIKDMATYQRWIGIPNRSEYQVASAEVQAGEVIFKDLQCHSCHVIGKIAFVKDDNILPDEEREHLQRLKIQSGGQDDYPFISYLGTDLLMHDMGYLSQVAKAPDNDTIRKEDDTVKEIYKAYIQAIRTPALKGLRFNRFVTDSNHNTKAPLNKSFSEDVISGCDFLLHDGRACDAIEAAYLHDGPAIKVLGTIDALNNLDAIRLDQLRAFLYSL